MEGINKAILIGNLGKDPALSYTQSGTAACRFSLATSESYSPSGGGERKERTDWHNIVVWGGRAEAVNKYLHKGSRVYIEGRIESRSWEQDGVKKYMTEINAWKVMFLDKPTGESAPRTDEQEPAANTGPADDDIPF